MWRKEEQKSQGVPEVSVPPSAGIPQPSTPSSSAAATGSPLPLSPRAAACITQGIRIKGEISGKEDLFVDGTLEGKLDLGSASCTVGPNGKVDGIEKVQLWNTGRVTGEVRTERLAIEDGAILRGKVESGKPNARSSEARANHSAATSLEKSKAGNVEAGSRAAVI